MSYLSHVFRRHQCEELGWEWWQSSYGHATEKDAAAKAERSVARSMEASLVPVGRSRFRTFHGDDPEDDVRRELSRVMLLRSLNLPFFQERAKWPTITEDCSEEAIAILRAKVASADAPVEESR